MQKLDTYYGGKLKRTYMRGSTSLEDGTQTRRDIHDCAPPYYCTDSDRVNRKNGLTDAYAHLDYFLWRHDQN